jgi:TatD DNase family protein
MIDTHAHLHDTAFGEDLPEVLTAAQQAGIQAIICPALDAVSSKHVLQIAAQYPLVYPAVGIQPNSVAQAQAEDWQLIEELAKNPRVVAIGETGLDRYWDFSPFDLQEDYFDRHLWLASKLDLPVIVHCREAEAEVLHHLREHGGKVSLRGVIHAFSGDREVAEEFIALGFYLSFAGSVTYRNKKFERLREAARNTPLQRILVETDSPYLVPEPFRGKIKRNHPALLRETLKQLALLREMDFSELAAITSQNARALFRLPGLPQMVNGQ